MNAAKPFRTDPIRTRLPICFVLYVGVMGCTRTNDGPQRFHVSGKIFFDGEMVPAGRVEFIPDTSQGNRGPTGYAEIEQGLYDTAKTGKGTVGGPHQVVISGQKQPLPMSAPTDDHLIDLTLFPKYSTSVTLPTETSKQNFDVPKPSG